MVTMLIWTAAIFVSAGTIHWVRGWICLATYAVGMTIVGVLVKAKNRGLLEQRANWRRKDSKRFDKIFLDAYLPLTFIQPLVA